MGRMLDPIGATWSCRRTCFTQHSALKTVARWTESWESDSLAPIKPIAYLHTMGNEASCVASCMGGPYIHQ